MPDINQVVRVNILTSPTAQTYENFGVLNIVGISDVIPMSERIRQYSSMSDVADDFASADEEYKAANIYFSQSPTPSTLTISRRAASATSAELLGSANVESVLATWQSISDGAFTIEVDGSDEDLTALDFSSVTSLADVATVIDTAFSGSVEYDGARFLFKTASTGATSSIGYLVSPSTGTDITQELAARADSSGAVTSAGFDIEAIADSLDAIQDATDIQVGFPNWYCVAFTSEVKDDADAQAVALWVESKVKLFANNSSDLNTYIASNTTNISYVLKNAGYKRTFTVIDANDDYPAVSVFARMATVNFSQSNSTITLKFKQLPGITPDNLTNAQASAVSGFNCNYYSYYGDSRMLAEGVVASGVFIDEVQNLDWLQNNIETNVFNTLYSNTNKVPLTDAGTQLIVAAIEKSLELAVTNGTLAPGQVTIDGEARYLSEGYIVVPGKVADMSQADIDARKSPAIKFYAKGSGAIHSADIEGVFIR